jgi:NADH dehydrogenase [ubiquinone] 1 alpha subcomplex assembly factor 7
VAPDEMLAALQTQAEEGRVRFDVFMETILYHPRLGYYAQRADRAGREGDFLTGPELSPLFGACAAQWARECWQEAGSPERFHLVEVGAGRGTLAANLMGGAAPDFASALRVHLVERGTAPRRALQQRFSNQDNVRSYASIDELPSRLGAGAFVANELFDNLPVRRLMRAGGWKEVVVRIKGRQLREDLVPAPKELVDLADDHGLRLAEGQTAEVCPAAVPLLASVLDRFEQGGLLVFDYGGEADEVSGDAAPHGTLAAHRGHSRHPDVLSDPGDQDVTAHVNFTPLRVAAEARGFAPVRVVGQGTFLLEHGLVDRLQERVANAADDLERLRWTQWAKQLYHPEAMGSAFRAMYARKRQHG